MAALDKHNPDAAATLNPMTRKDYQHIAEVLSRSMYQAKQSKNKTAIATIESITGDMVQMLKSDNEKFDIRKFFQACNF